MFAMNARRRDRAGLPALAVVACLLLACASPAAAQSEDALKSAFIFNFAKFTTWPSSAFAGGSAPLVVGIVGAPALADTLGKSVVGKNINGHAVEVKAVDAAGASGAFHVLVVAGGQGKAVAAKVKGKPVLLVGQDAGFIEAGGMINLIVEGGKVSFEISPAAGQAASLEFDPKLKSLAKTVK
jgi:hypothetical protein